jgi:hypothetical protein
VSRKHNTKHLTRGKSHYGAKGAGDKYGEYREGIQKSADRVAGTMSFQPKKPVISNES